MSNYLRSCAGCSAHLVIQQEIDRETPAYCAKCTRANDASWSDFDPRPYPARDQSVRRWSEQRGNDPVRTNGEWVVLAREGDVLTVRPLGFPDRPPVQIHISDARPRSDRRM